MRLPKLYASIILLGEEKRYKEEGVDKFAKLWPMLRLNKNGFRDISLGMLSIIQYVGKFIIILL